MKGPAVDLNKASKPISAHQDLLKYFEVYKVDGRDMACLPPHVLTVLEIELDRFAKECDSCPTWAK